MSYEKTSGLNVNNQYGARHTGGGVGVEHGYNSVKLLRIDLTGDSINEAVAGFVPPVKIPKGAQFKRAILRVDEAFTIGGTSPVVNIGGTAPGTNGITLTESELESTGTKVPASTGNGTWAFTSATSAAELITIALGGTSPTVTGGVGKATLILEYVDVAKA